MCGIVGAYDLTGRRLFPDDALRRMVQAIRHRGPEQDGFVSEPGYATGVARLVLRDAPGGVQPMRGRAGYISLNGELFSYTQTRQKLKAQGAIFQSASDTEVFLHGLESGGVHFLSEIDAQFSLAYYDAQKHTLLLARDRFGITPLFYAQVDGWLLFASEAKALFASGLVRAVLNANAIDHVLCRLALNGDESCFEGVHAVPPGQRLLSSGGSFSVERYASQEWATSAKGVAANTAELETLLTDAVSRRLAADSEVALYLSGGVDSSLIAALAAKTVTPTRRDTLTAYSIQLATRQAQRDESLLAAETARQLGIRHTVLSVSEHDIVRNYAHAVHAAEMPVLDHASVCLMLLAERVKADGNKAVLTGEGADEAFAGYPWQRWGAMPQSAFRFFSGGLTRRKNHAFRGFRQYPLFAGLSAIRGLFYSRAFLDAVSESADSLFSVVNEISRRGKSPLQKSLALDYEWLLGGHLLVDKGDRVAMRAAVETRYPFLDKGVVAFARGVPDRQKLRGLQNKWLLRRVAERHLPHATAWRGKHLFRAEPAIHGTLRPRWVDQLLAPEAIRQVGLFDAGRVQRQLRSRLNPSWFSQFSPTHSLAQAGLSGVVATQLLYHLYCGTSLCDLTLER